MLTAAFCLIFACGAHPHPPTPHDTGETECPDGFWGDDCALCSWDSAGDECQPGEPADLFDLAAIRAMSLEDLGWVEGDVIEGDGGIILTGDIFTPFPAVNADGENVDVQMRTKVALYLPDTWPDETPVASQGKAMEVANHYARETVNPMGEALARLTDLPVVYQGEYQENWTQLGFATKSDLYRASDGNIAGVNRCEPSDLRRGNHRWVMAEIDMRVMTLVQRLAEEAGGQVDTFALRGFSKEAAGARLACLVDDRIEVCSPGGNPAGDHLDFLESWIAPYGCDGNSAHDLTARYRATEREWYLTTPAGALALHTLDPSHNLERFTARAMLIDGDVHMPEMHDGNNFMLGPEASYLDRLDARTDVDWRYVRKATVNDGATAEEGDNVSRTVVPFLVAEMLVHDNLGDYYPKVESAEARVSRGSLKVEAEVSGPAERAVVWWSWSTDRVWNDDGQAEWTAVELTRDGTTWSGEVDLGSAADQVIGWYVEAGNTLVLGGEELPRSDASPIRFLQEPDALTCDVDADFCEQAASE